MGPSGVGDLVDVGRASDDDARSVAGVCQLPASAALRRRIAGADVGRSAGHLRVCGCAHRIHVHDVVEDAASGAE